MKKQVIKLLKSREREGKNLIQATATEYARTKNPVLVEQCAGYVVQMVSFKMARWFIQIFGL